MSETPTHTPTPPSVFFSYSRADSSIVERLRTDLGAQGVTTWVDREGIRPGTPDWEESLRTAIRAADAVLLVASPNARSSRYVKDELRIAQMYQRPIYPVWVTGTQWMEAIPLGLGGMQYIDAREERYTSALSEIVFTLTGVPFPRVPGWPEPNIEPRNPYKGLRPFTSADAHDFFGRDALIQELLEALKVSLTKNIQGVQSARLLAVVGTSGSGKSSVVMAGLLPCLQTGGILGSKGWVYLDPIVPGLHPIESLTLALSEKLHDKGLKTIREDLEDDPARGLHLYATALAKPQGTKVVLFVDQFEELFTLTTSEDERRQFVDLLINAITEPGGPVVLILTLRVDFSDRPMQYPELYRLIDAHHSSVLPMEIYDLRGTIEQPAALPDVQLTFEGDLVGDLLFEIRGQTGALPLLQFTLDQLFQRRSGHQLSLQSYREIGGVKGALSQHAEGTYQELPSDEHRQVARDVFLRLIKPGTTEQDTTRRRAARSEFEQADSKQTQQMQETLEAFISARLLTTNQISGKITIEVSHEALIREWKRLAEWLREARDDILFQQSLSEDSAEWEQRKRPRDRLYRGIQLKEALTWARRNRPNEQEVVFLRASTTRRIQSLVSLIAVVLLLLSLTGIAGGLIATRPPDPTVVTTLQDNVNGSLRYCIENAPPNSTIRFTQGLRGTIKLRESLGFLSDEQLTIHGPGADQITISGGNIDAKIQVPLGATLNISDLSFKNSVTVIDAFLSNQGSLTVTNSTISDNKTNAGVTSFGGGIYNTSTGTLTVINSTFSNNSSFGEVEGEGGGIYNEDKLTVTHSTFSNNSASSTGTLTVTTSTFSNNSTSSSNSIANNSEGGGIYNEGKLTVTHSTFSNNSAISSKKDGSGGGINNTNTGTITVTDSIFSDNKAIGSAVTGFGGGINNTGKLTVTDSTFSGNSASGGIYGQGGGIDNDGKLTVTDSTFSGNSASSKQNSFGGGILSFGSKGSSIIILFSTIYGNTSSIGGGIWIDPTGSSHMTMSSSVIAANSAHDGPDISGALISDGYNLIENVAGAKGLNAGTDRQVTLADLNIDPTLRNNGGPTHTLALLQGSQAIDAVPLQTCSITVTDPSGQNVTITTDQRGDPRPDGSENACDIGAYESSYSG